MRIILPLITLFLLLLSSCDDRDLSGNPNVDESINKPRVFGVEKTTYGYEGYLSLDQHELVPFNLNLNSNRITLNKESAGSIACVDSTCNVSWFSDSVPSTDGVSISTVAMVKNTFDLKIITADADFFINEDASEESPDTICDDSFGVLNTGEAVTISLLPLDDSTPLSTSTFYIFGAPNNTGSLPVSQDDILQREAQYAFDFDSYFLDQSFDTGSSFTIVGDESFWTIRASSFDKSKIVKACLND